jgi:hypothetical protein
MRRILFAMLAIGLSVVPDAMYGAKAAGQDFDGKWEITQNCKQAQDGALPYAVRGTATVTNGLMEARYAYRGPGGGTYYVHGPINPDGTANLTMDGITGRTEYTVGKLRPGVKYAYGIAAKFAGSSGLGNRTDGARECYFEFKRQEQMPDKRRQPKRK